MPRPRKDSEILSATERLENAFWELLADHEYRKITVTEVVREAHVNRNSFYYHYASLPELADSAIMHAVEHSTVQAPRADLNPRHRMEAPMLPGDERPSSAAAARPSGTARRQP